MTQNELGHTFQNQNPIAAGNYDKYEKQGTYSVEEYQNISTRLPLGKGVHRVLLGSLAYY